MERKQLTRHFSLKSLDEDGTFEGYGSVFGVVDYDNDIVAPGAFAKSLALHRQKGTRPIMAWQHDSRQIPGVWMEFAEDHVGLRLKGRLLKDDVVIAREAYALMKAQALDGLSVGISVSLDEFDRSSGVRTIKEAELFEVSLVPYPSNDFARIQHVKSISDVRSLEQYLRDAGASRQEAKGVIARVKDSLREAGPARELEEIINKTIALLRG